MGKKKTAKKSRIPKIFILRYRKQSVRVKIMMRNKEDPQELQHY